MTQINKIRNEKRYFSRHHRNTKNHKRLLQQLYAYKMDSLESGKLLERHNLPRPNQGETENINRPMRSNEIETVI